MSEVVDALGGHDWANLEAVIVEVWRYSWSLCWSEFRGSNRASVEMHLEAMMVRTCRL